MKYKMIVTDLDDTLLNSNLEVGEKDFETILELDKRGIPLVLCSGRATASVLGIAKKIFPDFKGRFIIGFNGAEIFDLEKNEVIYSCPLDRKVVAQITDAAEAQNIAVQVYKDDLFLVKEDCPEARNYKELTQTDYRCVGSLRSFMDFDSPKVLMNASHEKLEAIYPEIEKICKGKANLTYSKPNYLEIFNLHINKGVAIQWLADYLQIPIQATIAMGDSPNDWEMLKLAGLSVAVQNARPEIEKIATRILQADHNGNPLTELFGLIVANRL